MTTEEKAKAYDEALERMKSWARGEHPECFTEAQKAAEFIFPELKEESEDERIRKEMIDFFKGFYDNLNVKAVDVEPWIAWLEKQGEHTNKVEPNFKAGDKIQFLRECGTIMTIEKIENGEYIFKDNMGHVSIEEGNKWHLVEEQKPADKVEPKFHEGEWITNGDYTWQIVSVTDLDYILQSQDGNIVDDTISHVDEQFHSFTIEDTKDGDVLACNEEILLFKSYSVQGRISLYCWYNGQTNNFHSKGANNMLVTTRNKICPATKEQQNLLFKKMKESGYEWNTEKKELMKIKQKSTDEEMKELLRTEYEKGRADAIAEMQKSWSEEDELHIRELESLVKQVWATAEHENDKDTIHKMSDLSFFLKTLKPQLKQEWSGEDEMFVHGLIRGLAAKRDIHGHTTFSSDCIDITETIAWLKSLKDRVQPHKQWKPREIQKDCIEQIIDGEPYNRSVLIELFNDLKKL